MKCKLQLKIISKKGGRKIFGLNRLNVIEIRLNFQKAIETIKNCTERNSLRRERFKAAEKR